MNPLTIIASSCPLILCATGGLFSEFAGILALFLDGMISFSAFLTFTFTTFTGNAFAGTAISIIICCLLTLGLTFFIEKLRANYFIAGIALNLLFSSVISMLSFFIFGNQGVLVSPQFVFNVQTVKIVTIIITVIFVAAGIFFLYGTRFGIYLRITGSDSDVLTAKGVNPAIFRLIGWTAAAFYAGIAGSMLAFRISSFVPNIASGRGWMALAAVFLGKKKSWRIALSILIFSAADIFASNIQNYLPGLPSYLLLSLPYFVVLLLIFADRK